MKNNFSKKLFRNRRSERGMALLFALSILSIALIMAMIFSQSSVTERKVSSVSAESEVAKSIADSMAWRGLASLILSATPNKTFSSWVCSRTQFSTYPGDFNPSKATNDFEYDWVWKLETPGVYTFETGPFTFETYDAGIIEEGNRSSFPSWEYVWNDSLSTAPFPLIGRYAYVAMANRDAVNPNALGKTPDDNYYKDEDREKHYGVYPCEMELDFSDERSSGMSSSATIASDDLRNRYSTPWPDVDSLSLSLNLKPSDAEAAMMNWFFQFSTTGEYEKFRPEMKNDSVVDPYVKPITGEQYRISLVEPSDANGNSLGKWENGSIKLEQLKSAIPYFAESESTFVNQTLANIITAFSPETESPVSDVEPENWANAEPKYTGNKRTPYLNELAYKVELAAEQGAANIVSMDVQANKQTVYYENCKYKLTLDLKVETCSIFKNPLALGSKPITVCGTLDYQYYDGESGSWKDAEQLVFEEKASSFSGGASGSTGYGVYETTVEIQPDPVNTSTKVLDHLNPPDWISDGFFNDMKVRNVKLKIDKIILADSHGNADLALMPSDLQEKNLTESGEAVVGSDSLKKCGVAQTNDPRCNLQRDQWASVDADETNWTTNIGLCNSSEVMTLANSKDGASYDAETVSDPAWIDDENHLSTAFIRHAAPKSFWELGAISRGEPWRTINFKCAKENVEKPTFGDYADGDGHLLDQLVMTPMTEEADRRTLGKINLNCIDRLDLDATNSPLGFRTLFNEMKLAKDYETLDSGASTETIDKKAYAQALAKRVSEIVKTDKTIKRRTALFPNASGSAGSEWNVLFPNSGTDAEREELICRTINLLKWNQLVDEATVVVLAQSIKDVGGLTLGKTWPDNDKERMYAAGYYNPGNDRTFGSKSVSSGECSTTYGKYDIGFDSITGEAKAVYRIHRDNSGKWIIAGKEYAN